MVVGEGELGLAFLVLSFQFNVVRVLVFLILIVFCRSLLINETTAKHKGKHRTIWWYQIKWIELDFRRILVVVLRETELEWMRYDF
jgi:hypothetical protein